MKKFGFLFLGLIIIACVAGLACCGSNPDTNETLAQMKTKVDAAMNTTNLDVNVTKNITLPAASGDVAISWSSDKTSVISNTGVVTRPAFGEADSVVQLTGSFSYKEHSDTKVYTLTVESIKDKVYTFANGHSGENAIFTAPTDGSFGSITDKGEGVITLVPASGEGAKNAPYFNVGSKLSAWQANGFKVEVQLYIDHEEIEQAGGAFTMDLSLNKAENAAIGTVYVTFDAGENNAQVYHNHSTEPEEDTFDLETGWYNVGISYHEKNGNLAATVYINDIMDVELHKWEITQFSGFAVPESTGEHESVSIELVAAPRNLSFTNVSLSGIDLKKVTLSYND